jgi:nitrogenase subunit NifH
MIIYGEGGSGKSKVIQTVTEAFVQKASKYILVKSAYTGNRSCCITLDDGGWDHE